jgi:hypothetical protein
MKYWKNEGLEKITFYELHTSHSLLNIVPAINMTKNELGEICSTHLRN